MEAARKAEVLNRVVRKMGAGGADIQTSEWVEFVDAQNDDMRTVLRSARRCPISRSPISRAAAARCTI